MAILYTDNFNRSDSPSLGGSWVTADGFAAPGIEGNAACAFADTTDSAAYWNAATPDDQWCEGVLGTSNYVCGPAVRITSGAGKNCYFTQRVDDEIHLAAFDDDIYIALDIFTPASINPGDIVRLEAEGTTIRVYYNSVLELSLTSSIHTTGFAGFFTYYQAPQLDSITIGNFLTGSKLRNKLLTLNVGS